MALISVKTIVKDCLRKETPLSVKRDILGVFESYSFAPERSLKERLELIQTRRFIRVALVTIEGANPQRLQESLDFANNVYLNNCGLWIYCCNSITIKNDILLNLNMNDCNTVNHVPTNDEIELYSLGRDLGSEIICYFIRSWNLAVNELVGVAGCAAHPQGLRGFTIANDPDNLSFVPVDAFAHELTHVVGQNDHACISDNLMYVFEDCTLQGSKGNQLVESQCERILNDSAIEKCF